MSVKINLIKNNKTFYKKSLEYKESTQKIIWINEKSVFLDEMIKYYLYVNYLSV